MKRQPEEKKKPKLVAIAARMNLSWVSKQHDIPPRAIA